jgi:enterochelin esterase family protein
MMPEMLRWLWRDYPRPDNPQDEGNRGLRGPITAAPEKP